MCLKTVKREVYSAKNMPRDPKKIDDAYEYMRMQEIRMAQMEAQAIRLKLHPKPHSLLF